jgi:hypothetical protein
LQISREKLIILAGAIWAAVGAMLLGIGVKFLFLNTTFSAINLLALTIGLVLGYFKGKWVIVRSAQRNVSRINALGDNAPIYKVYSVGMYALIVSMIALGWGLKLLEVPLYVRGCIDVAVGVALIQGARSYFQANLNPQGV